jgi:hypothetical protein
VGHFLAVYPPHVGRPLDDARHVDVSGLATWLTEGPSEAWEFGTRALDPRKHLRVAASIAMRSATGDLRPWGRVTQRDIRDTYHVSADVARNALGELRAAGIIGHHGDHDNVMARDLVERQNASHRPARILALVADHVIRLEAEVSVLRERASPEGQPMRVSHGASSPPSGPGPR